jgi:hypothetical protein
MRVTAEETFLSPSGQQRARLCRREDGLFQVVTERLCQPTDENEIWTNDYPESGLFALREDARLHLTAILPGAAELHDIAPCTFRLEVGPYPEPVRRTTV